MLRPGIGMGSEALHMGLVNNAESKGIIEGYIALPVKTIVNDDTAGLKILVIDAGKGKIALLRGKVIARVFIKIQLV